MNVIGVDVGGTFTDIIMVCDNPSRYMVHKVQSTPDAQEKAVVRGIQEILEINGFSGDDIDLVVHGTTVATNAMLQRKGASVTLITTEGLEDVIEIGRQNREEIYSPNASRPQPIVDRAHRVGVHERVGPEGEIITRLSREEVERVFNSVKEQDPEAVAIALLFSFRNNEHELALLQSLSRLSDKYVVASSQVLPEFREFERVSTTVVEAYLGPVVLGYLERLDRRLREVCPRARLTVMQSNGGTRLCSRARGHAIGLALSGLAGGVMGAWEIARRSGIQQLISLDMGGTSCDISAIDGGVVVRADNDVGGMPLRIPSVDVKTIGAGGGSIAWIDKAGVLHVGPQSAGADPGPAAYNLGGMDATVTDANLVLGRLNPYYFLGGKLELSMKHARKAVGRLAKGLGMDMEEAALGIIKISSFNMMEAIREVTVERGHDPRDYVLVPFGGAGATQAVDIAEALGIRSILVPPFPGITSALGLLCTDLRVDLMKTILLHGDQGDEKILVETLEELSRDAQQSLEQQGAPPESIIIEWRIDMRYQGQSHELMIHVPFRGENLLEFSREHFESSHENMYGYQMKNRPVEWVTARAVAVSRWSTLPDLIHSNSEQGEPYSMRELVLPDGSDVDASIYRRDQLAVDQRILGPAIVEQVDTTIYIGPDWDGTQRKDGTLFMRRLQD
ncbi:MAG: hydantoinase/oxoprolinase family protein [Candidatus Thorarchaeota archaeon]|nr:hydantoinase/oxoprolinase family protein [Candidatus Thorarchaeota archaeon]